MPSRAATPVTVATSVAFWALGLHNPVVWGVLAGVLNVIPYVGPTLIAGGAGLAGFHGGRGAFVQETQPVEREGHVDVRLRGLAVDLG